MDKKLLSFIIALPIISIILTASIVFNSKQLVQPQINFPEKNKNKKVADSFINHVDTINYSKTGRQKSQIIADKLLHYPGDKDSQLIQPIITFFRDAGLPVIINADNGYINQNGTRIILVGHVIIKREKSQQSQFFQINAPALTIWPDKEYAETDTAVQISSENNIVNAIGMKAHLDREHYILLNRVKGHFKPVKRNN